MEEPRGENTTLGNTCPDGWDVVSLIINLCGLFHMKLISSELVKFSWEGFAKLIFDWSEQAFEMGD